MPSPAIPAATLILLRPAETADAPPEMLMVQRTARMAFAAGAWVWPGGRIDAADDNVEGIDAPRVAAVREMLEEVGIPVALDPHPDPALARQLQHALLEGRRLADLLDENGIRIVPERLRYISRWAPNFDLKRRFDTHFLVATVDGPLPPVRPQPSEVADTRWTSAAAMLDRIKAGDAHAIFPTLRTLEWLDARGTLDAILDEGRDNPRDRIVPWIETRDGTPMICIPDDRGYPVTAVPRSEVFRGEA